MDDLSIHWAVVIPVGIISGVDDFGSYPIPTLLLIGSNRYAAVFVFIEGWYNPHRRHSGRGYASPMRYELAYAQTS